MAYSSLSSILLILPGLPQTDVNGSGYTETAAVVNRHITRADSLIDTKIAKRYSTPITPSPPMLTTLSEDITAYFTYRSFYTQDNHSKSEYFEELYRLALDSLEQIREGDMDLVGTTGSIIPERTDEADSLVDSTDKNYQPYFDVDSEFNWKFDEDLLDDIKGKR